MTGIPYYVDPDVIARHWSVCSRCKRKGKPNGDQRKKRKREGSPKRSKDSLIMSSEEEGRLLLCVTCSAATHEGCLPKLSKKHMRDCLRDGKLGKAFQCSSCLSAKSSKDGTGLFRCLRCTRSYHYKCLPPFPDESTRFEDLMFTLPIHDKTIKICNEKNTSLDKSKEFLVKWSDTSYRHLTWVSEGWLKCVAKATYKTYTDLHKNRMHATEKELVPLAWKKIDRIMDVQDKDGNRVESSDRFLHKVFAKFQELDNDQACWDSPPSPEDVELYADYQNALNRYTQACKVIPPENMKELVMDVRKASRAEDYSKREMKKQPSFITGGTLMPHQMDGLNWLTYQWERKTSCVLADDMGLGGMKHTASNWLREFEKWAPEMTVVPFYGSNRSRLYTRDKELFRDGQHKLRCHAVILTYQSALAETTLFNKVDFWPVLVIDEAQRMKNNDTLLFKKLMTLNTDHRILMTGTPLQNNIRELINIMHFVDPDKFGDIETLEERYSGLTRDNVQGLHDLLRPYFLRRTKEVVLKNLPPKNEIIVPVSMTSLQKEVCKNLMEKNLISYAALHSGNKKSAQSRRSLSNILMQLRKALNHPYLIPEIEVQQATPELTHQVLIDACAKLKVLHQMLPKLFQNGHRVLIFSTLRIMLDILEDYLTGERIKYARLDGLTPSVDRTRSIDAFNAKDSDIKVFLLTSRAGGVGINLATADTVIIWDFDCNPHVDMQAVGRAYRIGQTKPVLVLRFMTRYSVEEKIAQVAKAKLVMDHLVVEKMDQADFEDQDIESILKFGAQALFDDNSCKDISYDSNAIDRLLDRSALQVLGNRPAGQANENEDDADPESNPKPMSFSFAKVWRADKKDGTLEELVQEDEAQEKENEDFWNRFLREKREKIAAEKANVEHLGRGARRRVHV
ncbi:P-loop containing nucleoside triphosphate hydrolase protein, partial [Dichotomocladium elegans]